MQFSVKETNNTTELHAIKEVKTEMNNACSFSVTTYCDWNIPKYEQNKNNQVVQVVTHSRLMDNERIYKTAKKVVDILLGFKKK